MIGKLIFVAIALDDKIASRVLRFLFDRDELSSAADADAEKLC